MLSEAVGAIAIATLQLIGAEDRLPMRRRMSVFEGEADTPIRRTHFSF
jgi:hypothetical protein